MLEACRSRAPRGRTALRPLAGFLAGWFATFLVVKGSPPQSTVASGRFFRLLMPAFPAFFLLAASIPLLVPEGPRAESRSGCFPVARPRSPGACSPAWGSCSSLLPLLVISFVSPLSREQPEAITIGSIMTPVDPSIEVDVRADGARRTLTWTHRDFGATKVFYRVFRTAADGLDFDCLAEGSPDCRFPDAAARLDARDPSSATALRRPTRSTGSESRRTGRTTRRVAT